MTIVCGTDFSVPAAAAVRAAAAIAARRGETLRLVHVQGEALDPLTGEAEGPMRDLARTLLRDAVGRARELGADVAEELAVGDPATQLLAVAERASASLVVVAWLGRREPTRWLVGSVAEHVARASHVPVLVVRDAEPILAWTKGERPLSVMIADDLGPTAAEALRSAAALQAFGPARLSVAHVAWPPALHERLGERASADLEHLRPEVEATLRAELSKRAADQGLPEGTAVEVQQGFGRADNHLTVLADRMGADLLVIGSHQRAGLERLWKGSVSRGLLLQASQNVLCVPPARDPEGARPTPHLRSILVATDFSELGDAAVPMAFAAAPPGSTVHLLHVVPALEERAPIGDKLGPGGSPGVLGEVARAADAAAMVRLAKLVPKDAAARGVEVGCEVAHGGVVDEILGAVGRHGADLICLGSHARSGIAAAVLGSVAREVTTRAEKPVLVVPRR